MLKIDHSFVDGMSLRRDDRAIVESVLGLWRTRSAWVPWPRASRPPSKRTRCAAWAAATPQGYHYARPAPPGAVSELLRREFSAEPIV